MVGKAEKTTDKKKTTPKTVVNSSKKESKTESFIRIAEPRVKSVLRSLRILSNCSNRNNYEYNESQVSSMFESIYKAVNLAESKFTKSKTEQESFSFKSN